MERGSRKTLTISLVVGGLLVGAIGVLALVALLYLGS
jgi:hypothetical protein